MSFQNGAGALLRWRKIEEGGAIIAVSKAQCIYRGRISENFPLFLRSSRFLIPLFLLKIHCSSRFFRDFCYDIPYLPVYNVTLIRLKFQLKNLPVHYTPVRNINSSKKCQITFTNFDLLHKMFESSMDLSLVLWQHAVSRTSIRNDQTQKEVLCIYQPNVISYITEIFAIAANCIAIALSNKSCMKSCNTNCSV